MEDKFDRVEHPTERERRDHHPIFADDRFGERRPDPGSHDATLPHRAVHRTHQTGLSGAGREGDAYLAACRGVDAERVDDPIDS